MRALRAAGATVYLLHQPVDLLVGYRGVTHLLEVKRPAGPRGGTSDRGLTMPQQAFLARWRGAPVSVVTTETEALAAIGADLV